MKKEFFPDNFTSGELYVIEKIWIDLTEKSNTNKQGIDANIFSIYTNIDGLLETRLFEVFDSNSKGYIDLENFINGLRIICLGTLEEYAKFLFDIFDVKKESKIEKIYMSTILNSIPHKYICKCVSNLIHDSNHLQSQSQSQSQSDSKSSQESLSDYSEWTNNCICVNVFKKFDTKQHDYLEWDEFLNWIKSDDILLKYIRDSINYKIQNESKRKNSISKTDILPKTSELSNRFESDMWKIGKRFGTKIKRYYLLYGSCLYYYKSKYDIKPKGVIFLSGSIIIPIEKNEIEISELNLCTGEHNSHQKRTFVCDTENLRNEWVKHLQKASHYITFESIYFLDKEIGVGAFSSVHKCIRKSDSKEFAVKIIDKSHFNDKDKINLKNEISILKLVSHPNIIHMDGFYESKTYLYFVIEFIGGGDLLENILRRSIYTDVELKHLAKTIAECLAYLHELGIVHRDIKPENILCDNITGKLILTDFGLSQMILPDFKLSDTCGTLDYVAPEILELGGYGMETDIWSLGIILYLVYYGKLPFTGLNDLEIINNIKNVEPIFSDDKNKLANDLISKLLDKKQKTRITAHEILSHPFILSDV